MYDALINNDEIFSMLLLLVRFLVTYNFFVWES